MTRLLTPRVWFGAFVLAATLLAIPLTAGASHSWANYHWARTSNPFTIKLADNVSSTWDSYLATTSSDWSQSSVLNTTIVPGGSKGRNCRATSGRVEVCNSAYGNNGWLGVAQIWVKGSHITQGTVRVNDTYFNSPTYNTPAWRNLVMCQEVGHTFGLAHQDENFTNPNLGSCMDYTNNPGTNQHPNAHDYDQLEAIYAHLDSTTTVGAAKGSFANAELDSPSAWGQAVAQDHNGKSDVFVRHFGKGQKVITFVIWAE
ncbi:MAG: hypothetical protein ACRDHF_06495 [Tepidiformaceae bacterium]